MSDLKFLEAEALSAILAKAIDKHHLAATPESLTQHLAPAKAADFNALLVKLVEGLPPDLVAMDSVGDAPADHTFGMRLPGAKAGADVPERLRFFRVEEAAPTIAINTIGLAIAIALMNPAGLVPALMIAKSVWENLMTLDRAHDTQAIRTYEALVAAEAAQVPKTEGGATLQQIVDRTAGGAASELSGQQVLDALKRLLELKLVRVGSWGGESGDMAHAANRWTPAL